MPPEANPATGALTVEQAAQQMTGLLGGPDEAKDDDAESKPASEVQPKSEEGQPEGEPKPEAESKTDEPAEEAEAPTEPADIDLTAEGNRKVTIKVNGKLMTMPLAEAIKGVQLEHDYRAKTSDVAEQRKALEAERTGWNTERQQHAATLRTLYDAFQQNQVGQPPSAELLDPANPKYDPSTYHLEKARYDERVAGYQQRLQQLGALQAEYQARQQAAETDRLKAERDLLVDAIPEFGDAAKAKKLSKDIRESLQTHYGFTPQELAGVTSAKLVRVAHDAHRWRTAGANIAAKTAAPKPGATLKPGVGKPASVVQSEQRKAALDRHRQSGTIESGARALAQLR